MTPDDFIAAIGPAARELAVTTKIPASFTTGQAALESAWGKAAIQNNLFGIKADASWHGPTASRVTHEFVNGQRVTITAKFRAYPSWLASLQDHAAFLLTNPRYKPAFAHTDGPGFARAIAACGYATDPDYAQKIIEIINAHGLQSLDA